MNGTPSVKVVRNHHDGGSVFPCRWIISVGIYNADSDTPCLMKVYGDGKLLYEFNGFEGEEETEGFSINVEGVDELTLQMRNDYTTYGNLLKYEVPVIYITDAVLES